MPPAAAAPAAAPAPASPAEVGATPEPTPVDDAISSTIPTAAPSLNESPPATAVAPVQAEPALQDPLRGGGFNAGGFDPDAGIIDDSGSEMPKDSKAGLMALIAAAGIAVGAMGGYLLSKKSYAEEVQGASMIKGKVIFDEINAIKKTRASVSLKMGDLTKAVAADGKAGAQAVTAVVTQKFKDHPEISDLFGYEMAAMPGPAVKKVFDLYDLSNRLIFDLGSWAQFVNENAAILGANKQGPAAFAVRSVKNGAVLVAVADLACGVGADGKTPVPCKDPKKSTHLVVQETIGGPTAVVSKQEVQLLLPQGTVFKYAIGEKPEHNVTQENKRLRANIMQRLEQLNEAEKAAIKAFEKFEGGTFGAQDADSAAAPAGGDEKPAAPAE